MRPPIGVYCLETGGRRWGLRGGEPLVPPKSKIWGNFWPRAGNSRKSRSWWRPECDGDSAGGEKQCFPA